MSEKKLVRVEDGRIIAGVTTGLGAYFGIDPVLVRVMFVILTLLGFFVSGVILYAILWAIMPMEGSES